MLRRTLLALSLLFVVTVSRAADSKPLEFQIIYDAKVTAAPFSGRVYVMLSKRAISDVVRGVNWFQPEPVFAVDVKGWKPGEALKIDGNALAHPTPLAKLPKGKYWVQAVMDFNRGINFSAAEGNGYSKAF